ncbi:hypothetical protein CCACVL1_03744 [Corchorus capsularis]|uniref:Uncharacterized protein n=1 Tax=Corchorus capsularis TaxID=210143 RepID=A0A1R3JXF3_COCAP|nr:hypothetical protein CCACVL1_03744 [Corchorus capsularis]
MAEFFFEILLEFLRWLAESIALPAVREEKEKKKVGEERREKRNP